MEIIKTFPRDVADRLLDWAIGADLEEEEIGNTITGRHCRWYGVGVNKSSGVQNWKAWFPYEARPITGGLRRLAQDIDPTMTFNSVLLYRYPEGVGIGRHSDKPIYGETVTLVHLCRNLEPGLFAPTEPDTTGFLWVMQRSPILLKHGDVVRFNSRAEHGVSPVPSGMVRVSIQFREVKL